VCNNGNCITTCPTGTECSADQFCQGTEPTRQVCSPKTFKQCAIDQDCPNPQFCLSGLCVSVELRRDGGFQGCLLSGPDDACAPEAICLQQQTSSGTILNNCIGMPACGQDGTCPVGNQGSVCNDMPDGGRLFQNKQRVCLFTFCTGAANCPSNAECFLRAPDDPRGECTFGIAGDPCFGPTDCFNSSQCVGADGGFGDGGSPGTCQ
jgi:hypothetical protein